MDCSIPETPSEPTSATKYKCDVQKWKNEYQCVQKYCTKATCNANNTTYYDCNSCIIGGVDPFNLNGNNKKAVNCGTTGLAFCGNSLLKSTASCLKRTDTPYMQTYKGGFGGYAPPCAYASLAVSEPTTVKAECTKTGGGKGTDGNMSVAKDAVGSSIEVTVGNGVSGKTCRLMVNSVFPNAENKINFDSAFSTGGQGGPGAQQPQYNMDVTIGYNEITKQFLEQQGEDASDVTVASSKANSDLDEGYLMALFTAVNAYTNEQQIKQMVKTASKMISDVATNGKGSTQQGVENFILANLMFKFDYSTVALLAEPTSSLVTGTIHAKENTWICLNDGGPTIPTVVSDRSKLAGKSTRICKDMPKGSKAVEKEGETKIFNELYTWSAPFATKFLGYGAGGSAGTYKSAVISEPGVFEITLGKGGVRKTGENAKAAAKGGDTIVKHPQEEVKAQGGDGGANNIKSNKFQLCYAKKDEKACEDLTYEKSIKSTKEIAASLSRKSAFENIASDVGNSSIVGIGMGRGAEGVGSYSDNNLLYGTREAYVDSPNTNKILTQDKRIIYRETNGSGSSDYINKYLDITSMEYKGGDGAVIITW